MAEDTGLLSSNVSAGDDGLASQYNNLRADTKKMRQEEFNAGATIAGATLPVPVYQNTSDNEVYACDANVATALEFFGFAISDGTDGNAIIVQHTGIVGGFTGLDEGEKYYVQDAAGTIGKAKGSIIVLVGNAISSTELLIIKEESKTEAWAYQELIQDNTLVTPGTYGYDVCFSDDKLNFYLLNTITGYIYVTHYKMDLSTGLYYRVGNITVVSAGSTSGGGVTYYNGYVYVIGMDSGGTQFCKRYADDLTGATTITISGGANSEKHSLTNNGATFYTFDTSDLTGGYYTLSGTTLTRGGDIAAVTGMSGGGTGAYMHTLANDGTNLIIGFSYDNTVATATELRMTLWKVPFAGGAASALSTIEKFNLNRTERGLMGITTYGDNTAQEYVVLRMLFGISTAHAIWDMFSMKKINKSIL